MSLRLLLRLTHGPSLMRGRLKRYCWYCCGVGRADMLKVSISLNPVTRERLSIVLEALRDGLLAFYAFFHLRRRAFGCGCPLYWLI